jgi:hypothetical protein
LRGLAPDQPQTLNGRIARIPFDEQDDDELRRILKHPKGGVDLDRYDGVIVIQAGDKPRVSSFAASGRIKTRIALSSTGEPAWERSFCAVLPPISRKP